MNFNTLSVSKLKDLKRQVEAAIHAKVTARQHEIELELLKLSQLDGGEAKAVRASAKATGVVKTKKLRKSVAAVSLKASAPRKPRKTRKARKETRKPETVRVAPPQVATSMEPIEVPSIDIPAPASISASETPAELGVAA
jgi:hypothetical protein